MSETTVRYPSAGQDFEAHHAYPLALLELALSKTREETRLTPSAYFMQQGRALRQLEQNIDIDVMWTMTSSAREALLEPIRIPIYKGLIGWRVFLTTRDEILTSKRAIDLDDLRKKVVIQGHDWPDTPILSANGFNVQTSPSYAGLFQMLEKGRADLFPRSVIEVWSELDQFKAKGIGLESHTVISYPAASYYFVSKDNPALAEDIYQGLMQAHEDGSFEALFQENFGALLDQANIAQRTHYQLNNPVLSEQTPVDQEKLWYQP